MRSKIVLMFLEVVLFAGGPARATTIDFNSANPIGTIQTGDNYNSVTLHDSAVVTMIGGTVGGFSLYNNSVLNISGGILQNATIFLSDSSILNVSGGQVSLNTCVYANQNIVNIYGHDLSITPNPHSTVDSIAAGHWADSTPFTFQLMRTPYDAPNIVFHEIPEPNTLLLLGVGVLAVGKRIRK
jgi:hypothetical protein